MGFWNGSGTTKRKTPDLRINIFRQSPRFSLRSFLFRGEKKTTVIPISGSLWIRGTQIWNPGPRTSTLRSFSKCVSGKRPGESKVLVDVSSQNESREHTFLILRCLLVVTTVLVCSSVPGTNGTFDPRDPGNPGT